MTEQLDKIMGKPIQYVKPHIAEARIKGHIKTLDRESFTEGISSLSMVSKLRLLKEKCDTDDDETACDVYEIAVNGDDGHMGLRQMWENDGNIEAKSILEQLGELQKSNQEI